MSTPADISLLSPTLRSDVTISVVRRDGRIVHLLEDSLAGKVFQIGSREAAFLLAMDGGSTIGQFLQNHSDVLEPEEVAQMYHWGHQKGIWQDSTESAIARDRQMFQMTQWARYTQWLNPISLQLSLGCPERYLQPWSHRCYWLFSWGMFLVWLLLGLVAGVNFYPVAGQFARETSDSLANGGWLMLVVVWLVAKVVHETAHAVACHRVGARVNDVGFIFVLFMPLAYVDVSSCNRLSDRWARIMVSAAGIYIETLLSFIAILVWMSTENLSLRNWMQAWVVTSGITTLLFNANPLMKFDGYYILSDLLEISNLANRGRSRFWGWLRHLCLGIEDNEPRMLGWRGRLTWWYGLASLIWKLLLSATLILASTALFHGAGILLAVLGTLAWLLMPAVRWFQKVRSKRDWQKIEGRRLAISLVTVAMVLVSCLWILTGPVWLSAPAIVQHQPAAQVRSDADGFVVAVMVSSQADVKAGQPLIQLQNPDLDIEIQELQLELQQADLKARLSRQESRWAESEADEGQRQTLQSRLEEKLRQREQLTLCAPSDGTLIQSHPGQLIGKWVKRGEVMMTLDSPAKEIVVSVSQDDLPSLKQNRQLPVRIDLTGWSEGQGQFMNVIPNASLTLAYPAMSQLYGGPLAVHQPSEGDPKELTLLMPRFEATVTVPKHLAADLPIGQTGYVYFRSVRQSLATYLFLSARRWFESHLPRIV